MSDRPARVRVNAKNKVILSIPYDYFDYRLGNELRRRVAGAVGACALEMTDGVAKSMSTWLFRMHQRRTDGTAFEKEKRREKKKKNQ